MSKNFLPKIETPISPKEAINLTPLSLAFVGDSVQTLYVRTRLLLTNGGKTYALHRQTTLEVRATAQAKIADLAETLFTEEERAIYHRARNSNGGTQAKHATSRDYKKASGLEAVFGYLYLTGQEDRLLLLLEEYQKTEE